MVLVVKNLPTNAEDRRDVGYTSLGWEDPLEKEMVTHSSILENLVDRGGWWAICNPWSHNPIQLATKQQQPCSCFVICNTVKISDHHNLSL